MPRNNGGQAIDILVVAASQASWIQPGDEKKLAWERAAEVCEFMQEVSH